MIRLLFVGDGERDAACVPRLVEKILDATIEETFHRWARLHGSGKGYKRKLRFAHLQAQSISAAGLVATLDCDKDRKGQRLAMLRQARDEQRQEFLPFPTALGEAVPHAEAWLLDDGVAVRGALGLPRDAEIPNVRRSKSPKSALESLIAECDRSGEGILDLYGKIAEQLEAARCVHKSETGFEAFVEDVSNELRPLVEA